jgi:hypothetical protein
MSHLTDQQKATLKAYILADPVLAPLTSGPGTDFNSIALALNADASPAFTVWRTSISRRDCQSEGFDWTQADNLTTGQARVWDWLFDGDSQSMNPSESGKRAGVSECWKGTAAKVANATFVLNQCKRSATQAEKVLATGTGTQAVPATMTFEGAVSVGEIAGMFP